MPSDEDLAHTFPEVDIETLGKINEMLENPTVEDVAETLESAKRKGKVPDADYMGRLQHATEPQLHPEFERELEKEGLDPEKAEEGLQAEQEVEQEDWERKAKQATEGGISDVVGTYVKLDKKANKVLQSPMRVDLPDHMDNAYPILVADIDRRISQAGVNGQEDRLRSIRDEIHRLPSEPLRDDFLDSISEWLRLAENQGAEFDEAREWLRDAESGEEMADRLEQLRAGKFDIDLEQFNEIVEAVKQEYGLEA